MHACVNAFTHLLVVDGWMHVNYLADSALSNMQ